MLIWLVLETEQIAVRKSSIIFSQLNIAYMFLVQLVHPSWKLLGVHNQGYHKILK